MQFAGYFDFLLRLTPYSPSMLLRNKTAAPGSGTVVGEIEPLTPRSVNTLSKLNVATFALTTEGLKEMSNDATRPNCRRHFRSRQVIENGGKRKPRFRLSGGENASDGVFSSSLNRDCRAQKTPHRGAGSLCRAAEAVRHSRRSGITRQLRGQPEQPEPSGRSRKERSRSRSPERCSCSRGPSRRQRRSRCRNRACWCGPCPRSSC